MPPARIPTNLTGTAGEYFTAAELSARGWLTTMTIKNAPGIDILAQHAESRRLVSVQVKTKVATTKFFPFVSGREVASAAGDGWFVFVSLNELVQRPDFFVVPQPHVMAIAHVTREQYSRRKHGDPPRMSCHQDWIKGYAERWQDLEAPNPKTLPYRGDTSRWELFETIRLPIDHPWGRKLPRRLAAT